MLEDEEQKGYVREVVEEAKAMLDMKVQLLHVYTCIHVHVHIAAHSLVSY